MPRKDNMQRLLKIKHDIILDIYDRGGLIVCLKGKRPIHKYFAEPADGEMIERNIKGSFAVVPGTLGAAVYDIDGRLGKNQYEGTYAKDPDDSRIDPEELDVLELGLPDTIMKTARGGYHLWWFQKKIKPCADRSITNIQKEYDFWQEAWIDNSETGEVTEHAEADWRRMQSIAGDCGDDDHQNYNGAVIKGFTKQKFNPKFFGDWRCHRGYVKIHNLAYAKSIINAMDIVESKGNVHEKLPEIIRLNELNETEPEPLPTADLDASYKVQSKWKRIWNAMIRELRDTKVGRHAAIYKMGTVAARSGVSLPEARLIAKDVLMAAHGDLAVSRVEDEIDRNILAGFQQGEREGHV